MPVLVHLVNPEQMLGGNLPVHTVLRSFVITQEEPPTAQDLRQAVSATLGASNGATVYHVQSLRDAEWSELQANASVPATVYVVLIEAPNFTAHGPFHHLFPRQGP